MKRVGAALCGALSLSVSAFSASISLEEGFRNPPNDAKPQTFYHLMNGNVTKEGVTRDFEALARAGIGGVLIVDAACFVPPGPLKFNTPEWYDFLLHVQREAMRFGLEITLSNCSGWSSSGGPWNTPENAMKVVVFTETAVKGPARFGAKLPRTSRDNGFYEDIAVIAYPTPEKGAGLSNFNQKIGRARSLKQVFRCDTRKFPAEQVIYGKDEIDLTERMKADETLEWDVPDGDWTILRIGHACTGTRNHPASETGCGLEVDKLSAKAVDHHFRNYVGKVLDGIKDGVSEKSGIRNIHVDSWEVGYQNWTQGFDSMFERRFGYSIRPWLPVFAGRIVESVDRTERFLEDFRRLIADALAENYAGRLAELCRERGFAFSAEPYGYGNFDDFTYGRHADVPMGEFWSMTDRGPAHIFWNDTYIYRLAAYLSHVWGRRFAAAEAFTAQPHNGSRWLTTPFQVKTQGDVVYARGINRFVYHRYVHQPWAHDRYFPGMTMGRWGMHLDRSQTWWHLAPSLFSYQARCQWMLQEGRYVADVLYWNGEEAPNTGKSRLAYPVGRNAVHKGFSWDFCATEVVESLKVRDGKVVVPGGVEYRLLVLPDLDTMSAEMVRRIGELVDAGAKVVSTRRPVRAPGMNGLNHDMTALVESVWRKGVMECSAADALKRLSVAPDFKSDIKDVEWIHRTDGRADWYFISLANGTNVSFEVSFRTDEPRFRNKTPEIWDAETGVVRSADVWRGESGRTFVTLDFPPSGSAFVVFRERTSRGGAVLPDSQHVVSAAVEAIRRHEGAVRPVRNHTLVIRKAEYGVFPELLRKGRSIPSGSTVDITDRVAAAVKEGKIDVRLNGRFAGRDPARGFPKGTRIEYEYDGVPHTRIIEDEYRFRIPLDRQIRQPAPVWEWRDGRILAWQPLTAKVAMSDGRLSVVSAEPPEPQTVEGGWDVDFPQMGGRGTVAAHFPQLECWSWNRLSEVKYFSGTATYRKSVRLNGADRSRNSRLRMMLDLGEVREFAEVTVNGWKFPALWKPPYRVDITDAVKSDRIDLEIRVTNLWPNRLIGDDTLYRDDCRWNETIIHARKEFCIAEFPQWVKEGRPSPTGRHTFTTYKHWTKDDELVPSGLIGPVAVRFGEFAK